MSSLLEAAQQAVDLLKKKEYTVCTAESCTGGMIASSLISISGASHVIHEGYITYSDMAKQKMLQVDSAIIARYKAVSAETAAAMAAGGLAVSGADFCISVTGVAGPDTEDGKPVGLVYLGYAAKSGAVRTKELHLAGSRAQIRSAAAEAAIRYLIDFLSVT